MTSVDQGDRGESLFSSIFRSVRGHKTETMIRQLGDPVNRSNGLVQHFEKKTKRLRGLCEGLAHDARTCGDPHLDHNHAQKRFYCIRTDFHPRGDLLGRQTSE